MKKIVSLLVASFMIVSVMGQVRNRTIAGLKDQMETGVTGNNFEGMGMDLLRSASRIQLPDFEQSAIGVKQQLDSVIYERAYPMDSELNVTDKETYSYDAKGQVIKFCNYNYAKYINFTDGTKDEYTFDANGDQVQSITYVMDPWTNQWLESKKVKSLYNPNRQLIQTINYGWSQSDSKWMGAYRAELTYNASGNQVQIIIHYMAYITSLEAGKLEITKDSKGNVIQSISYQMDKDSPLFVPTSRNEYAFDSKNHLLQNIYSGWDKTTNQWLGIGKEVYSYNSKGNQTQSVTYSWYENINNWDAYSGWINQYVYDSKGNETQKIVYRLLYPGINEGEYSEQFEKYESAWDSQGNNIEHVKYRWDALDNAWEFMEKNAYTYDWNGNLKKRIFTNRTLLFLDQTTWYYSEVKTPDTEPLKTFPNPASAYIFFNLDDIFEPASFELFDVQGEKVISQVFPFNRKVQVSQLRSGMYFYSIQQNDKIYKGKVMIQ